MGIKSTQTISRADAIARMSYIITLLEEVMDTYLFRFSTFENYKVVRSLKDLEE